MWTVPGLRPGDPFSPPAAPIKYPWRGVGVKQNRRGRGGSDHVARQQGSKHHAGRHGTCTVRRRELETDFVLDEPARHAYVERDGDLAIGRRVGAEPVNMRPQDILVDEVLEVGRILLRRSLVLVRGEQRHPYGASHGICMEKGDIAHNSLERDAGFRQIRVARVVAHGDDERR